MSQKNRQKKIADTGRSRSYPDDAYYMPDTAQDQGYADTYGDTDGPWEGDFYDDSYNYDDANAYAQNPPEMKGRGSKNQDSFSYPGKSYGQYDDYDAYDTDYSYDPEEERARAAEERKRKKRRHERMLRKKRARRRKLILAIALIFLVIFCVYRITHRNTSNSSTSLAEAGTSASSLQAVQEASDTTSESIAEDVGSTDAEEESDPGSPFVRTKDTAHLGDVLTTIPTVDSDGAFREDAVTIDEAKESAIASSMEAGFTGEDNDYVASPYMILVNADTNEVVAERSSTTQMYPASMTKVMTLLVAADHLSSGGSLDDTVEITQAICDESWLTGSSYVGYAAGDTATVRDLLYGAILPSGADAAIALADWTAGSEEAFASLMNAKAAELGISDTTHFTNCVGTFDVNHYTTAEDMALIMETAMENDLLREVLSAHTYHAAATASTPDGFDLSNWFLRKIEDKDTHGTVLCAKTGYVKQSGNCAVSYEEGDDGSHYILVTGKVWESWRCIYDQVAVYSHYVPSASSASAEGASLSSE